MLTFSRGQAGELLPLAIKPLVGEDIKMLRSIIPSSIDISVECEPELPEILVDPIQLHQVIMNLCINARDAIGQKGEIKLGLQQSQFDEQPCHACHEPLVGHFVELAVSDNGGGISAQNMQRIFEPFFSTKEPGKGTGMGLHTVSAIMHEAGGHILVESQPGEGTTFRLFFPMFSRVDMAAPRLEEPLHPVEVVEQHRGRILVVDDEVTVANLMRELLGSSGYEVAVATSGAEALELLSEQAEGFDLLITDHNMPGVSGVELAQRCSAQWPALPVILNSGFKDGIEQAELSQTNVKEIMQKPVQLRELLKIVQQNIQFKP
jgi:CheY-like chemotaxis protein